MAWTPTQKRRLSISMKKHWANRRRIKQFSSSEPITSGTLEKTITVLEARLAVLRQAEGILSHIHKELEVSNG